MTFHIVLITFRAYGHPNVLSTHKSTLEFTKDSTLTKKGDCILGIKSTIACLDLPDNVKNALTKPNHDVELTIRIQKNGETLQDVIRGKSHPALRLKHPHDMVIRKSDYICDRTLFIHADKAARDINPKIINAMKDPTQVMTITLAVYPPSFNEKNEIT